MKRSFIISASVCLVMLSFAGSAVAEHRASQATFAAINKLLSPSAKTLQDHLASVNVSSKGPYALAYETGGQSYRELFKRSAGGWHDIATVSIATGFSCSAAPAAVIKDLKIDRYIPGGHCTG